MAKPCGFPDFFRRPRADAAFRANFAIADRVGACPPLMAVHAFEARFSRAACRQSDKRDVAALKALFHPRGIGIDPVGLGRRWRAKLRLLHRSQSFLYFRPFEIVGFDVAEKRNVGNRRVTPENGFSERRVGDFDEGLERPFLAGLLDDAACVFLEIAVVLRKTRFRAARRFPDLKKTGMRRMLQDV